MSNTSLQGLLIMFVTATIDLLISAKTQAFRCQLLISIVLIRKNLKLLRGSESTSWPLLTMLNEKITSYNK